MLGTTWMKTTWSSGAIASLLTLLLTSVGSAQTGSLAVDSASGFPGTTATVGILMDNDVAADAFSFGLVHDPAVLTPTAIVPGDTLDSTAGGVDPDVFFTQLNPGGADGITVGCLMDLGPPPFAVIPVGTNHPVVQISYEIDVAAAAGSTPLSFSGSLGSPPVDILLVLDALDVTPATTNGNITIGSGFLRGDSNGSGGLNLIDPVLTLYRLFGLEPMGPCLDAEDSDDNGILDVNDVTYLMNYLFDNGPDVPAPFGSCGGDSTADNLDCQSFDGCP